MQIVRCINNAYLRALIIVFLSEYPFQDKVIIFTAQPIENIAISDSGFIDERPKTANTIDA